MTASEREKTFLQRVQSPLVKAHAAIAFAAFSIAWLIVAVVLIPDTGPAPSAVVPPVVGLRFDEAERKLAEAGLKIALASSADPDEVRHHQETLGIDDVIDKSTSKEDADHSKPYPEIFEAALKRLKTKPDDTITVGDTPWDVLASHRASLSIAAVLSGGFDKSKLAKAEFIFRDVRELPKRLAEIDSYLAE